MVGQGLPIPSAAPGARCDGRAALIGLRLSLSVTLLTLLLRRIAPEELERSFARAAEQWPLLIVAYVLPFVGILFAALRWQKLMNAQGVHRPLWRYGAAVIVGAFFNQVLPSTIGGDVARSLWVTPRGESSVVDLTVVMFDRALGVLMLCVLALAFALASPAARAFRPALWLVPGGLILVAVPAATIACRHGGPLGRRIFSRPALHRYREKTKLALDALRIYRSHWPEVIIAGILSLGLQLSVVAQYVLLAGALGLGIDLWQLALIVPVVTLVTLVPITINGLGLREGAFAMVGAPLGLAAGDAVALGWLFVAGSIGYGAVGGLIHLYGRPQ